MPKIITDDQGRLTLPSDFVQRRRLAPNLEYWLDEREGELILRPRLPDVRKLYIEPTTGCNLHCRTCIRNVWDEHEAQMSMNTFHRLMESLDELPNLPRVVFSG